MSGVEITVAESADARAQCLEVRRIVFIEEQGVSVEEEVDGEDDLCIHILAQVDGLAMGAARIKPMGDAAKVQRVCVRKEARGTGAGAAIMAFIIAHIRADGRFSVVRLGSQTHALDFYRKLGFREYGDEYLDAGIPHRDMELTLDS